MAILVSKERPQSTGKGKVKMLLAKSFPKRLKSRSPHQNLEDPSLGYIKNLLQAFVSRGPIADNLGARPPLLGPQACESKIILIQQIIKGKQWISSIVYYRNLIVNSCINLWFSAPAVRGGGE